MPNPPTTWMYGPIAKNTETDNINAGHGTCMVSKVAGKDFGVAKKANLIISKATTQGSDTEWAFEKVLDDTMDTKCQKRVVVPCARGATFSYLPGDEKKSPWPVVNAIMKDMFENDIVVVTSLGNLGEGPGHSDVDTLSKI